MLRAPGGDKILTVFVAAAGSERRARKAINRPLVVRPFVAFGGEEIKTAKDVGTDQGNDVDRSLPETGNGAVG